MKLTAKAPENGWLEYKPFLLGRSIFRCELLVLGRVEFESIKVEVFILPGLDDRLHLQPDRLHRMTWNHEENFCRTSRGRGPLFASGDGKGLVKVNGRSMYIALNNI